MEQKLQPQEPFDSQAACQATPTKGGPEENRSHFPPDSGEVSTEAEETTDIRLWVRSLRYDSPVRALALEVLAGKPPSTSQPLLDRLADPAPHCWKECAVAAWVLGHSTFPETDQRQSIIQRLCRTLGKEELQTRKPLGKRFRRRLFQSLPVSGGFGLLITLMFLVASLVDHVTIDQGLMLILDFINLCQETPCLQAGEEWYPCPPQA